MITEDYVSFETAKLLKEKGFPQDPNICNTAYTFRGKFSNNAKSFAHNFTEFNKYGIKPLTYSMAPTLQMAMKWLREEKEIYITIVYGDYPSLNKVFWIPQIDSLEGFDLPDSFYEEYNTYEEACEAAIKYCLKILI